ncbi:hypothetical protein BHM03_00040078, partial [Ensete ventricosum]
LLNLLVSIFLKVQKAELRKDEWRYFVHYLVSGHFELFEINSKLDKEDPRSTVSKGKKRKAQSGVEDDKRTSENLVKLQFPLTLKKQLVDDWEFVTQLGKVTTFLMLIAESVGEILKGLRCYFDKALPAMLLYKKERQQYHEAVRDDASPSTVYGAEHLLRLFGMHCIHHLLCFLQFESILSGLMCSMKKCYASYFIPRFAISICTAWYGRYIPVRQVTGTWIARYRAVPAVLARGSPARRRRPRVACGRDRGRFFSRARRRSVSSPCEETERLLPVRGDRSRRLEKKNQGSKYRTILVYRAMLGMARLEKFPSLMCCVASRGSLGVRASATRSVELPRFVLFLGFFFFVNFSSLLPIISCITVTCSPLNQNRRCRCRVLWPFWLPWWRLNVSTWSDPGIDSVKDVEGSTALVAEAATPPALEIGWLQSLASDMDRLPDLKQSNTSADVYAAPTQLALSSGRLIDDASLRSTAMANPSVSSIDDEHLRLRSEYKWFLMASVRPERRLHPWRQLVAPSEAARLARTGPGMD